MANQAGYIVLDDPDDQPRTDRDGRVLGDSTHVRMHLAARRGITTVVVPPSNNNGEPEGYDPKMADDMIVNFDPGRPNAQSFTVSQLRQSSVNQFAPSHSSRTVVASHSGSNGHSVAMPPQQPAYTEDVVPQQQFISGLSPMAVLQNAGKRNVVVEPDVYIPKTAKPDKVVTFEVTGIGVFQAPYADVILQGPMIILVFDHASGGKMCYFPNFTGGNDQQPPQVAMRVDGYPAVYLIETTGVQFKYGSLEFCVLFITQIAQEE